MKDYDKVTEYFEKSLMLVNYVETQSALLEQKVMLIKNSSDENNIYENFFSVLTSIKDNCEKIKNKLSVLAHDLSSGDEAITELLDDVFLNRKQLEDIEAEISRKNINPESHTR